MTYFREVAEQIDQAMQADRHRLRNMLRAIDLAEQQGKPFDKNLGRLHDELDRSLASAEQRRASVPPLVYDDSLPIVARRQEIVAAIREHPVLVLSGETGSGKSTQLPKLCLEAGRGIYGLIGHTQPRRIAARSIAARLMEELAAPTRSVSEGRAGPPALTLRVSERPPVGYKIRFADQTSPETLIKVMTDGILLAETQSDRCLDQYDTIIIDEAHERSLNIDFLLGYLHRLLPQRPDLRLIITSATIDAQRFAAHFSSGEKPIPVIEVSGRTYPVEVRYRPTTDEEERSDPLRSLVAAVAEACQSGPGDVLVFLPTERDIREAAHLLRGRELHGGKAEILPLYARLTTAEQNRVFQPHSGRRIVLATNVAESSLTVPGIRFVVDTGTARISRYSPKSKVQRLPIEPVSQASCDQRKGRCGRIGPGVCIRLFEEDDYLSRDRFTAPEIQRTNLAAVILQTLAFELGPLDEFPLLDPPRPEAIRDGYKTLAEIGAIDDGRKLTPLGRKLARLPVDPRIGRMILAAAEEHCLADVLIIAAALETQDPRERPADQQQAADKAQSRFLDPDSDFLSYLRLWDFLHHLKETLSRSQFRKALWQSFLSESKVREWQEVHRQLLEMVAELGLRVARRQYQPEANARDDRRTNDAVYAAIHRSLLAGLLSNIAMRGDDREYQGAGGNKFFLWPGSGLVQGRVGPAASAAPAHGGRRGGGPALAEASLSQPTSRPLWILAAELVETTRRYARTAARIDPDWIEPLAAHLVSRTYSDPHWSRKSCTVLAKERVSLFGLTIIPERRIRYGPIDPAESRKIFIQHALVEQEFDTKAPFFRHNRQLRDELAGLAAKSRRRELIVDDYVVYRFYDGRLPKEVYDVATLVQWLKGRDRTGDQQLFMAREDLVGDQADVVNPAQFPERLAIDRLQVPLVYRFEPGAEQDGITATVPQEGLAQLAPERLEWLVPGMVEEKLEALIRTLPKSVRQALGPAPEAAKKAAAGVQFGQQPFLQAAAEAISRACGQRIAADQFDLDRLPPHLRINVRVLDEKGQTLAESRDVRELRAKFAREHPPPAASAPQESRWHRDGITRWDFGPLPAQIDVNRGGLRLPKYPGLVDQGNAAGLRLFDQADAAERHTREGIRRLIVISEHRELKSQVQWLPALAKLKLWSGPLFRTRKLEDELIDLLAERALFGADVGPVSKLSKNDLPRDERSYCDLVATQKRFIAAAAQDLVKVVPPLLEAYHEARLTLETPRPAAWKYALDDMRQQLADLTSEGFLTSTPWQWLAHYPRYLRAIAARVKKMTTSLPRDKQQYELLAPRSLQWRERAAQHEQYGVTDAELEHYRWMLEELRVSLFAQELGTSIPVSPQRLDKQWENVRC
jgi:ATP-dependent RNA helicase HrpA